MRITINILRHLAAYNSLKPRKAKRRDPLSHFYQVCVSWPLCGIEGEAEAFQMLAPMKILKVM